MSTRLLISGYVLAGGRSTRMGTEKALLPLASKPLLSHAIAKLRRVCNDVQILSGNPAFASYAPLVPDLHPGCGPISGIEAALADSAHPWVLILPVDVPFLPTALLHSLVASARVRNTTRRAAFFSLEEQPQPAICLLHKDLAPYIAATLEQGTFKLGDALDAASGQYAEEHNLSLDQIRYKINIYQGKTFQGITSSQQRDQLLWFANINTPQQFEFAKGHADALDT